MTWCLHLRRGPDEWLQWYDTKADAAQAYATTHRDTAAILYDIGPPPIIAAARLTGLDQLADLERALRYR